MTGSPGTPGRARPSRRARSDAGGVWIAVGIAGGVLLYAGAVLLAVAGFDAILPLVVLPPVVVVLIAGGGLLRGRPPGRGTA